MVRPVDLAPNGNNNASRNQNQPVNEQVYANLESVQEELDNLVEQISYYEGRQHNRALARIAELEQILDAAGRPHEENKNQNPNMESENPTTNNASAPTGGRRRKQRKTLHKSRKTLSKSRKTLRKSRKTHRKSRKTQSRR